jgi:hypothetical protein
MIELMSPGKLLVCLALLLSAASVAASIDQLLEKSRSDYAALVSAERDFHSLRKRGALQGAGLADYAAWVARLHRQVAEDCAALAVSGIPIPADISCPASAAVLITPAAVDQAGEQTGAEEAADLDAELFNGMSEFDEMLLREQERIRAASPHAEGSGGGGGGGGGQGGADGGGESGSAGSAGDGDAQVADDSDGSPTYGAGAGPGSQQQSDGGPPPDTPDGSDDDVVARQLREAAEKETDPVLKKKLWEEYRKYKEGTF